VLFRSLPPVRLPRAPVAGSATPAAALQRRSHRTFSRDPIAFTEFAALLGHLAAALEEGRTRHLYGSAGGLYPVQTYLHIQRARVDDLDAGTYYYHPLEHALLPLSRDVDLPRTVHAVINRPVFDQAAFSIFLVAQMNAIVPVYAERAKDFALIEAGLMAQLLEASAARCRIGLCQVGLVDFPAIRDLFRLEESHLFLHSLLGGPIAPVAEAWEEGAL